MQIIGIYMFYGKAIWVTEWVNDLLCTSILTQNLIHCLVELWLIILFTFEKHAWSAVHANCVAPWRVQNFLHTYIHSCLNLRWSKCSSQKWLSPPLPSDHNSVSTSIYKKNIVFINNNIENKLKLMNYSGIVKSIGILRLMR